MERQQPRADEKKDIRSYLKERFGMTPEQLDSDASAAGVSSTEYLRRLEGRNPSPRRRGE
jgi:hypothetical protein